jgi:hypothetical protein
MLVQVTPEHTKNARRNSSTHCPIAISLRAMGYEDVRVNAHVIAFAKHRGGHRIITKTPLRACLFIHLFDAGFPVKRVRFPLQSVGSDAAMTPPVGP